MKYDVHCSSLDIPEEADTVWAKQKSASMARGGVESEIRMLVWDRNIRHLDLPQELEDLPL